MSYLKEAFYPTDISHAKDICLTPNTNNPIVGCCFFQREFRC